MDVLFVVLEFVNNNSHLVFASEPIRVTIEECLKLAAEINLQPLSESPYLGTCLPDIDALQNVIQS